MGIQNGTATLENSFIIIIIIIKQIQQFYSLVFNQIVIYIYIHEKSAHGYYYSWLAKLERIQDVLQ